MRLEGDLTKLVAVEVVNSGSVRTHCEDKIAPGLDMGFGSKGGVKGDSRVFGLSNYKNGLAFS